MNKNLGTEKDNRWRSKGHAHMQNQRCVHEDAYLHEVCGHSEVYICPDCRATITYQEPYNEEY